MATRITNQKLSKSSRAWMREHLDDPFVKRAQKEGYRARAAYKLLEIQEKYKLIKPGMTVVDLGAEKDNCEAVYGWVLNQVCCASCIRETSFESLQRRFVKQLITSSQCEVYYEW